MATASHSSAQIVAAVEHAFVSALSTGFVVGAVVALGASVAAWLLIEQRAAAPEPIPGEPTADAPVAT